MQVIVREMGGAAGGRCEAVQRSPLSSMRSPSSCSILADSPAVPAAGRRGDPHGDAAAGLLRGYVSPRFEVSVTIGLAHVALGTWCAYFRPQDA
jgi:hypothetical protein